MDPILVAVLKALGVGGPMGLLLGYTVKVLWAKLQSKESCKDPSSINPDPLPGAPAREHPPCNQCLACKDRQLAEERDASDLARADERAKFEEKVDELHGEVRDLLREMARAIQSGPAPTEEH